MENWVYFAAATAIFLIGFAIGTVISDLFATRYWEKEIARMKKIHESAITANTVAEFNRGVLAALPSENDKDVPND